MAADIPDLEAVESNFDQITYAKGGSVLVQLVGYVGRETFLEGLRTYFAEHAFGNTSLDDLLRALEEASGRDLGAWSAQWLEQPGVNLLALELGTEDGRITSAAVRQTAHASWPTLRDHRIAVGLYAREGDALTRTDRVEVEVSGELTPVPALVGPPAARPAAHQRRGPDLQPRSASTRTRPATALAALPGLPDPLSRAVGWQALWDATAATPSCRPAPTWTSCSAG